MKRYSKSLASSVALSSLAVLLCYFDNAGAYETRYTLNSLASNLAKSSYKNVVVVNGAGISVSAGIPDFRTPGTGLYDKLDRLNLPFPEAIFDISFYKKDPSPFVELAKEIWPGQKGGPKPTLAHFFVSLLEQKGCLRRVYTQNIDGLEGLAGISEDKLVECHGHFRSCSCTSPQCRVKNNAPGSSIDECRQAFLQGEAYHCPECGSLAKPDIVFFGETLPDRFQELIADDITSCDLLIVMGTSLLVAPVAQIPEWVGTRGSVPRLLINRELVGDFANEVMRGGGSTDVFMEGDCDQGVQELCRLVGEDWEQELVALREKAFQE